MARHVALRTRTGELIILGTMSLLALFFAGSVRRYSKSYRYMLGVSCHRCPASLGACDFSDDKASASPWS
jgi:hypothetical protein